MIVDRSDKVPYEHYMVGADRFSQKLHICLVGRSVSLSIVAVNTRCHQILPTLGSTSRSRHNMVNRESEVGFPAVLTSVAVATKNVLSGEDDFLIWNANVDGEADDAGKRHRHGNGTEKLTFAGCNQFGFSQPK